jgi:hypothetical protein
MTSLTTVKEFRETLQISSAVLRDEVIQEELERANRIMISKVGKYQIDNFVVSSTDSDTLKLKFNDVISVDAIYRNLSLLDSTSYELNQETGDVDFTGITFAVGDRIKVYYVPRIQQDLERLYAEYFLLIHRNIEQDAKVRTAKIDSIKELIISTINAINGRMDIVGTLDHRIDINKTYH